MKKILLILPLFAVSQLAFAGVGSLYESNTTEVKIKNQGSSYQVHANLGIKGCWGEFEGIGTLKGNTLTIFDAITAKEDGEDSSKYTMVLRFANNFKTAKIIQSPSQYYSGASCDFTDGGNPNLKKVR